MPCRAAARGAVVRQPQKRHGPAQGAGLTRTQRDSTHPVVIELDEVFVEYRQAFVRVAGHQDRPDVREDLDVAAGGSPDARIGIAPATAAETAAAHDIAPYMTLVLRR